ncbi:hypothetical protein ACJBPZ_11130, partial [Streptococcus suis]
MYTAISRLRHRDYRKMGVDPLPVIEPLMMLSSAPFRVNPMVLEFLLRNRTGVMNLPAEPVKPKLP